MDPKTSQSAKKWRIFYFPSNLANLELCQETSRGGLCSCLGKGVEPEEDGEDQEKEMDRIEVAFRWKHQNRNQKQKQKSRTETETENISAFINLVNGLYPFYLSCILYPVSCILYLVSFILYPLSVSRILCTIYFILYSIQDVTCYRIQDTRKRNTGSCIRYPVYNMSCIL